jgi:hypothetical protein
MEINETVVHGPGLMGGITGLAKNLFGLVCRAWNSPRSSDRSA